MGNPLNLTIVFLHGFLGDCRDFEESIWLLSNKFYCIAVDLPGHGKTEVIGTENYYKIEYITQGLIDFLQSLNIPRCILVGYSMGGRLALYLALHFPEFFSQIILESASPGLVTLTEKEGRLQQDLKLAEELESQSLSSFLNKWYDQPLFASIKQKPNFDKMIELRLQNCPQELAKVLRHLSTGLQPSLWEKLESNLIPLLLLVGELDPKFIGINRKMASLGQVTQLEMVSNCSHNIHLEDVNSFVTKIRNFIVCLY
jgi:2-succinyl-6-hydroxy-2,4-cyclohexadiene-1-carboxylate synthase